MPDVLTKILAPGTAETLAYAAGDFRGAEAIAANLAAALAASRRGFNLEAVWTAEADAAVRNQHDVNGIHTGTLHGLTYLRIAWNGATYAIDDDSEDRGAIQRDGAIATFTNPVPGRLEITMTTAFPSGKLAVYDAQEDDSDIASSTALIRRIRLRVSGSATVFTVDRYAGTIGSLTRTNGTFAFYVTAK